MSTSQPRRAKTTTASTAGSFAEKPQSTPEVGLAPEEWGATASLEQATGYRQAAAEADIPVEHFIAQVDAAAANAALAALYPKRDEFFALSEAAASGDDEAVEALNELTAEAQEAGLAAAEALGVGVRGGGAGITFQVR